MFPKLQPTFYEPFYLLQSTVEALESGHPRDAIKMSVTGAGRLREWFSQASTRGVEDRWPLAGGLAKLKYWYTKQYRGIKQTLKYGTVITVKSDGH